MSRMVDQSKIKAIAVEGAASLVTIEVLSSTEVGQILLVIENSNLMFGTFWDMVLFLLVHESLIAIPCHC